MMGESSTCLMRSFSQPSSIIHDAAEGDPIRALTSSISFGRYMSESLAWEKWSSFTHNRYMEEVEKYSRPGSVAQMKAYFEAHYKRKAAERAAALSEQQNAAAKSASSDLNMLMEKQNDSPMDKALAPKDNLVASEETGQAEPPKSEIDISVQVSESTPSDEGRELENAKIEEAEQPMLAENQVILSNQLENVEDAREVMSNQEDNTHLRDGATPGDSVTDKKKAGLPPTKSVVYSRAPKPPAPPKYTVSLPNRLSINASPNCKKIAADSTIPKPPAPPKPTISFPNRLNINASPNCKKIAAEATKPKPPPPPKPTISLPNRLNINASPNCKRIVAGSTNRKRETPRSLHMSINFASRETSKPLSPILQKIVNSRLVKTLVKASKDRTTQQTPTRASVDISKHPTVTPQQGNSRSRTYFNQSMCDIRKMEGNAQSPCKSCPKSPSIPGRKARSPIVSYAFSFKSEERALKRKEFFERLEQKQKAREAEKEQLQAKSKEKARCGYKDMHLSASSRPILHSKFSQGIESPSDPIKKDPPMQPCSPKLGRKTPSKSQDINSRPPWRFTTKIDGCNGTRGKSNWDPAYSAKSVSKTMMHENTSPNIQL